MNSTSISTVLEGNIVHLFKGKPITNSLKIALEFGRRHDNVIQSISKLINEGSISLLEFKERDYIDERGKRQPMIELTERGALIAMPFIGGKKSRQGQVRLVDAFLALREREKIQANTWNDASKAASVSFRAVMDALKTMREEAGKTTLPHHYMNESRMINSIMFGNPCSIDRTTLSNLELSFLEKIEAKNAYLIARGRTFIERKKELSIYKAIICNPILLGVGL